MWCEILLSSVTLEISCRIRLAQVVVVVVVASKTGASTVGRSDGNNHNDEVLQRNSDLPTSAGPTVATADAHLSAEVGKTIEIKL